MKKYSLAFLMMTLLIVLPYWSGKSDSIVPVKKPVEMKKINASLFEARLKHNTELVDLSESFQMKEELTDSILSKREEQINDYRHLLGYLESRNRYVIDNGHFIGAYQFGKSALNHIGLGHITREEFLKNPDIFPDSLQDWAVIELARSNQKMMSTKLNINKYVGKRMNGVKVTKGGILAAAHLIGWYDCSNYLASWGKYNPKDGNNTHASDYMKKFQDKDIVAFDIENDFEYDLNRTWYEKKLPTYSLDQIYVDN